MAVVVPIMAMYAGATAGIAMAAGAAVTLGGVLAVAGGMVGAMGLLSNDKKMQRMSGMFTLASGLLGGAAAVTGGGAAAGDLAGGAAATDAGAAGLGGAAAEAGGAAAEAGAAAAGGGAAGGGTPLMQQAGASPTMGTEFDMAQMPGGAAGTGAQPAAAGGAQPSALEQAARTQTQADVQSMLERQQALQPIAGGAEMQPLAQVQSVGQGPQGGSIMDSVKGFGRDASAWVRQNPLLAKMGFETVAGMYGPEAEKLDFQRSIYNRARANANSPVRMGYYPANKPTGG